MLLLTKSVTPETSHWLMSNVKLDIPWNKCFIDLFDVLLVSMRHFSGGLKDDNKWKGMKFFGSDKKSEKK